MSGDCSCLLSCGTYCEHGFPTLAEAERLRTLWFNENSAAQATLGRVRELLHQWETQADNYWVGYDRAVELRVALDGAANSEGEV